MKRCLGDDVQLVQQGDIPGRGSGWIETEEHSSMHTKFRAIFLAEGRVGLKRNRRGAVTGARVEICRRGVREGLKRFRLAAAEDQRVRYSWPRVGLD